MRTRGVAIQMRGGAGQMIRAALFAFGLLIVPVALVAQDGQGGESGQAETPPALEPATTAPNETPLPQAVPILVFDRDRVLDESDAGQAFEAEIAELRARIVAENEQIAAELEAEERAISEAREELSDADFRARADAFDQKVTDVRAAQDRKAEEVQATYDAGLEALETLMNSALTSVARELRAVVVFESAQVYLRSGAVDVSAEVIRRLDVLDGLRRQAEEEAAATGETGDTGETDMQDAPEAPEDSVDGGQ